MRGAKCLKKAGPARFHHTSCLGNAFRPVPSDSAVIAQGTGNMPSGGARSHKAGIVCLPGPPPLNQGIVRGDRHKMRLRGHVTMSLLWHSAGPPHTHTPFGCPGVICPGEDSQRTFKSWLTIGNYGSVSTLKQLSRTGHKLSWILSSIPSLATWVQHLQESKSFLPTLRTPKESRSFCGLIFL